MNDSTLNSVSSYLSTFERSYGKSDAGIRSAIRAMSDAAGTKDAMAMQSVMRSYGHIPEEESGRTMIWLADVASYSNQQDRHDLPPRIFFFVDFCADLRPKLTLGDVLELRIDRIPPQSLATASAEALRALISSGTPGEEVVVELETTPVQAHALAMVAANSVLEYRGPLYDIPQDVVEAAVEITGSPKSMLIDRMPSETAHHKDVLDLDAVPLHSDGVYIQRTDKDVCRYIRFFEDGLVRSVSRGRCDAQQAMDDLTSGGGAVSSGRLSLTQDGKLFFSAESTSGTVEYEGACDVDGGTLELSWRSLINGNTGTGHFDFAQATEPPEPEPRKHTKRGALGRFFFGD